MSDENSPRYFTDDEIAYIIDETIARPGYKGKRGTSLVINRLMPHSIRLTIYENITAKIRDQLREVIVTPLSIPDWINIIPDRYGRAMIDPESAVGITAAEAIGGPITQMALNAFHQSGSSKNVGSGIDNLKALLHLSSPAYPSCVIHFDDKHLSPESVLQKRKDIMVITMKNIIIDGEWDIETQVMEGDRLWYDAYLALFPDKLEDVNTSYVMRIPLNVTLMYMHDISMEMIVSVLEQAGGHDSLRVIPSSLPTGIIYVYVATSSLSDLATSHPSIREDNIVMLFFQQVFLPTFDTIIFKGIKHVTDLFPSKRMVEDIVDAEEPAFRTFNFKEYDEETQDEMKRTWIMYFNLNKIKIHGVEMENMLKLFELTSIEVLQQGDDYTYIRTPVGSNKKPMDHIRNAIDNEKQKETEFKKEHKDDVFAVYESVLLSSSQYWFAETNGSNLVELFKLPGVDKYRTYCNDVNLIYQMFGIDAARNLFIMMFKEILDAEEQYVDPRQIITIADIMFNQGRPLSISFGGATRRNQSSFLALMTMQQALNVVKRAGFMGRTDPLTLTSAAIMVNRQAMIGTGGHFDIIPDEEFLEEIEERRKKQEMISVEELKAEMEAYSDLNERPTSILGEHGDMDENAIQNSIAMSLMGHDDDPEPEAEVVPTQLITEYTNEIRPADPQPAPPRVVDPNLIKAHTSLKLPVIADRVTETIVMEEEPSAKKGGKKKVTVVEEPEISYFVPDTSITETAKPKKKAAAKPKVTVAPTTSATVMGGEAVPPINLTDFVKGLL
jgi:hypothetical protein